MALEGQPKASPPEQVQRELPRSTPPAERIDLLDALRGLALFGILLANIRYWAGWTFLDEQGKTALAGPSADVFEFLHVVLIDGKFYTNFSLLFGIGFALQLSRLETRSDRATAIYVRRMLVLLAIGITHLLLIWVGDILALYALCGLALLLVRRWPDRWLLLAALILIAIPVVGQAVTWMTGAPIETGLWTFSNAMFSALGGAPNERLAWLSREDLGSFLAFAVTRWPVQIDYLIQSWRIPKVLAIMMLGLWAGRRLIAGTLFTNDKLLHRVLVYGLAAGVPANLVLGAVGGLEQENPAAAFWASLAYAIGVVPLGLAYAAAFTLAWPAQKRSLRLFAPVGRMALTNYLSHSLLGILIFFGLGFGLIGKLGPLGFYGIAALIFFGQVLVSRWWLTHFGQGPIERLWRLGTYGRPANARLSPTSAA
jgi:uncharacterized protein